MTCGYLNSAGTDLDNIFKVSNTNVGALGFIASDGKDLGNRFTGETKLGYAVGYVNNAGTDIGYLRGAANAPSVSSHSLAYTQLQTGWGGDWRHIAGYFTLKGAVSNAGPVGLTLEVQVAFYLPNYNHHYNLGWVWQGDTTANLYSTSVNGNLYAGTGVESNRTTIYTSNVGSSFTKNFACHVAFETDGHGDTEPAQKLVFYYRFYNSFGGNADSNWIRKEIRIGNE